MNEIKKMIINLPYGEIQSTKAERIAQDFCILDSFVKFEPIEKVEVFLLFKKLQGSPAIIDEIVKNLYEIFNSFKIEIEYEDQ